MSELDIQKWLSNITKTVKAKDLKKHMDLVSENVVIYGMPNGQTLTYDDWEQRRQNEFEKGLLKSIKYDKLAVKNFGLRRLTFSIQEVMESTNGDLVIINKEIILEHEEDEQWRVVEEAIKNWKFLKGH